MIDYTNIAKIEKPTDAGQDKQIKDAALITTEGNKVITDSRKNAESKYVQPIEIGGAQSDKQTAWEIATGYYPRPGNPVSLPIPAPSPTPEPLPSPNQGAHHHGDNRSESGSEFEDDNVPFVIDLNDPFWIHLGREPLARRSGNESPPTPRPPAGGSENLPPGPARGDDGGL